MFNSLKNMEKGWDTNIYKGLSLNESFSSNETQITFFLGWKLIVITCL